MKRLTFPVLLTSLACVTILATDFAQASLVVEAGALEVAERHD